MSPPNMVLTGQVEVNTPLQPTLIQPGFAPVPTLSGQPGLTAGQVFPQAAAPFYANLNDYNNTPYVPQSGIIDPQSPTLKGDLQAYSLQSELASSGLFGQATAGCTYECVVYGNQWNYYADPPADGKKCSDKAYSSTNTVLTSFTVTTIPNVEDYIQPPAAGGYCALMGYLGADAQQIPLYLTPAAGGPFFDNVYITVIGQNCPGSGGFSPLMPILQPPPITFPSGIPLPTTVPLAPAPQLVGGTVTTNPVGAAGTLSFTPGPNGTQIANLNLPDCTCRDGVTPAFAIRNVTSDSKLPLSVTLVALAPNSYVFDFNIPPMNLPFVELPMQNFPLFNVGVQDDVGTPVSVWAPTDGTNDMRGFMGLVLEQLLELRAGIVPGNTSPPETAGGNG